MKGQLNDGLCVYGFCSTDITTIQSQIKDRLLIHNLVLDYSTNESFAFQ